MVLESNVDSWRPSEVDLLFATETLRETLSALESVSEMFEETASAVLLARLEEAESIVALLSAVETG